MRVTAFLVALASLPALISGHPKPIPQEDDGGDDEAICGAGFRQMCCTKVLAGSNSLGLFGMLAAPYFKTKPGVGINCKPSALCRGGIHPHCCSGATVNLCYPPQGPGPTETLE